MWYDEAIFYQIYPLGYCGAPQINDYQIIPRIKEIEGIIDHLKKLEVNAVYFNPLFESTSHGYDTVDYKKLDSRLGTNDDLKELVEKFHHNDIKVVLDGVFNHVSRDHFAFLDLKQHRESSKYRNWFNIDFNSNSNYDDGFWYEGWEGHYELVKLNLQNPDVVRYLLDCGCFWIDEFAIDGIRFDVAYMLDREFMRQARKVFKEKRADFFMVGEMIHGDYRQIANPEMMDSATNYECYKGIYSAMNSLNLFEIGHSLQRQFGKESWCLYTGMNLLNFLDNHDVPRIASQLTDENKLPLAYALMFAMPGIPCIYYGSEWGIKGDKGNNDKDLRPEIDAPTFNELSEKISSYARIKRGHKALTYGDFSILQMTNKQLVFQRAIEGERIIFAVNIDDKEFYAHFNANANAGQDLLTGEEINFGADIKLPAYSAYFWLIK